MQPKNFQQSRLQYEVARHCPAAMFNDVIDMVRSFDSAILLQL